MDDRLQKAMAFGSYRNSIENRKVALERRLEADLKVTHNGGIFTANSDLISLAAAIASAGNDVPYCVVDTMGNPIDIDDMAAFRDEIVAINQQAMFVYKTEMDKLKKARDVKSAMDW